MKQQGGEYFPMVTAASVFTTKGCFYMIAQNI